MLKQTLSVIGLSCLLAMPAYAKKQAVKVTLANAGATDTTFPIEVLGISKSGKGSKDGNIDSGVLLTGGKWIGAGKSRFVAYKDTGDDYRGTLRFTLCNVPDKDICDKKDPNDRVEVTVAFDLNSFTVTNDPEHYTIEVNYLKNQDYYGYKATNITVATTPYQ